MTRLLASLVFWAALFVVTGAQAHELRPAYLQIGETVTEDYDLLWKVPARGDSRMALYIALPDNCVETSPKTETAADAALTSRWSVRCAGGLTGRTISVDGLTATFTDVLARIERLDGTVQTVRLAPDNPSFVVVAAPTAFDTAKTYFLLGVEHILLGIDHLLFVLALLLLIRNLRTLIETITAFTLAHSITLAATALGWIQAPQPPVEAVIALSIVVVASEVVRAGRGQTDLSIRYPWLIAFMFGLLHGFGFGGALRDIGLPQNDVPLALLTFNLGVEVGQLIFIAVVLSVIAIFRLLLPAIQSAKPRLWAGYSIGSIAAVWFFQRIMSF